jgi:hypothetical protein
LDISKSPYPLFKGEFDDWTFRRLAAQVESLSVRVVALGSRVKKTFSTHFRNVFFWILKYSLFRANVEFWDGLTVWLEKSTDGMSVCNRRGRSLSKCPNRSEKPAEVVLKNGVKLVFAAASPLSSPLFYVGSTVITRNHYSVLLAQNLFSHLPWLKRVHPLIRYESPARGLGNTSPEKPTKRSFIEWSKITWKLFLKRRKTKTQMGVGSRISSKKNSGGF